MDIQIISFIETVGWLKIVSLPLIAAFIGWATNWLAVQLTFYPLQFQGVGGWLGWQGVIPRKAEKMAEICVDRTVARFGDLHDVFIKLEPERITAQILSQVLPRIEEYVDEVMYEHHAVLWDNLPYLAKRKIYDWSRQQIPRRIEALVAEFGDELNDLVDLKALFSQELRAHPELMVRIFKEAGAGEFSFIVKSGLLFGLLFGVVQIPVWYYNQSFQLLPLFGFIVGFATNWLALNFIFRPLNPRYLLGFRIQGLFLKRQAEVSEVWSRIIAEELITVEKVAQSMVFGKHAHRTRAIIQKHMRPLIDESTILRTLTQVAIGASGYAELKKTLHEKAIEVSTKPFHDQQFNKGRAPVVAQVMAERMKALRPAEFQDVLRPGFQEEEWQLMLIGGVIGALTGVVQWLFVF
ncbi:MAG: hypothetical protein H7A00_09605 [Hahellaceae bacterium]|nr:hypothetical protein [Hahellaceae bacterium]